MPKWSCDTPGATHERALDADGKSGCGGIIMLATGFRTAGIKSFMVANLLSALRSGHRLFQRPSPQKQIPSIHFGDVAARTSNRMPAHELHRA